MTAPFSTEFITICRAGKFPRCVRNLLTEKYGLITDCLAEYTRGMRRMDFTHLLDEYFHLNRQIQ